MFNDDEPLAFKRMHEFSAVDGFAEITESLAEMIKFIANEPSVGLFYIQQHTHSAPNLTNLKNDIEEKSGEVTLHAEDSEDSVTVIRSMKDIGAPIANEMIKDLRHSLAVVLKKQPKKGLLRHPGSTFQIGRTSSWSPATRGRSTGPERDREMASGYLSTVFRSAKEKANALSAAEAGFSFWVSKANDEELPLSSPTNNELQVMQVNKSMTPDQLHPSSENYEEVTADKEAKFEGWLGGKDNRNAGPGEK
ncbi:uncharacterized protein LOC132051513 [Lycium ferocissimum]|uniref:uncharacterized protein LOC132051513 n=1 Tax=Lycium ferocissimum TaxID=112874 RepID=UPI0028149DAD|nr:uncharacterized protein LOC132051513 [Lycium ferocissimum]XP_059298626.1 uncharacterized protein LOC132051513 [Lycium ferocissimum]XP_059298627.1 uncharacterized protein LOC132051513 [Lycium ferocissimum]